MESATTEGSFQALVIDDELYVREFVSDVLRGEGWNVSQSSSAEEALDRLYEAPWSVVFCDVLLGGANGYSTLRCFKEKLPEAKVVLMTGHGNADNALDANAFGAYDYWLKPFGAEEQILGDEIANPRLNLFLGLFHINFLNVLRRLQLFAAAAPSWCSVFLQWENDVRASLELLRESLRARDLRRRNDSFL